MSTLNDQVVDGVAQTDELTAGIAAPCSQALVDTVMSETIGMLMHNAVTSQHNAQMVGAAAVTSACGYLLRVAPQTPAQNPKVTKLKPVQPSEGKRSESMANTVMDVERGLTDLELQQRQAQQNANEATKRLAEFSDQAADAVDRSTST